MTNSKTEALPLIIEDLGDAMRRYDRLPKRVRRVVAQARNNFATKEIPGIVRKFGTARTAQMLEQADIEACRLDSGVWGDDFDHVGVDRHVSR